MWSKIFSAVIFVELLFSLSGENRNVIFEDDFNGVLNAEDWKIEAQKEGLAFTHDGFLVIDSHSGITVWLNRKLNGNYKITYDRTVVLDSGKNDRLSDFNQFWMADAEPFTKDGVFERYDTTKLYYLGYGGNYNSTTRFRKYKGGGVKPIIAEYLDESHLLKPNHTYKVITMVNDGRTTCQIDGYTVVDYQDMEPLKEGYFGFRTTWSRQKIGNIRIEKLK